MKKQIMYLFSSLFLMLACNKESLDISLETRGNDNHRNWKLASIQNPYIGILTDGSQIVGMYEDHFIYKCTRPYGRVASYTFVGEEEGIEWANLAQENTYNDNFMITEENGVENGEVVIRKFHYDQNHQWSGITTYVNGVALDDEYEIGPAGRVLSYTHDGVKTVHNWGGENIKSVSTYLLPEMSISEIQYSMAFKSLGDNKLSRGVIQSQLIKKIKAYQLKSKSALRSKKQTDWMLVQKDYYTVDQHVIQPYTSTAKGYPGSVAPENWLFRGKNFLITGESYAINEDGSQGDLLLKWRNHDYSTIDGLPKLAHSNIQIPYYDEDEDGNIISYNENSKIYYNYISGCNESAEAKSK